MFSFVHKIVLFGAFPRAKNRAQNHAFWCSPSCQKPCSRSWFLVLSFVPQIVLAFWCSPSCHKSCFLVLSLVPKNRALDPAFLCSPSCQKSCSRSCSLLQLLGIYLIFFLCSYTSVSHTHIHIYIYIYIWTDIHPYFCTYIMHQEVVYNIYYIYIHTCTRTHTSTYIHIYIYAHNINLHSHVHFYIPYIYVYHCIHPNASLLSTEQFLLGSCKFQYWNLLELRREDFLGSLLGNCGTMMFNFLLT